VSVSTKTPEQEATVIAIAHKIAQLGLTAQFVDPISVGPIVSVYRFMPTGSTRVSHLEGLSQDFAVVLGAEDIMAKRMPGEVSVGIFVPNRERQWVKWFNYCTLDSTKYKIPLILGVDYLGKLVVEDLTSMPHLLIAGSTGGGKSTLLNSIIGGLILNYSPKDVQFVLSDTKGVEFNHFEGAPHVFAKTATSVYTTLERFDLLIEEMEDRLKRFSKAGKRNILEYNSTVGTASSLKIPYVALAIDELADLLGDRRKSEGDSGPSIGKIAEAKLSQLAQKARATGIHIIAATQRPSVKIIDGNIKANFPARLTFRLPSETDSRTVLGTGGAEHLLSKGDMLFTNPNKAGLQRIHAPLASVEDIQAAIEYATRR
jgi:DNA segregation ATPase FtsK/SpoIIIE, S-DNA-T family